MSWSMATDRSSRQRRDIFLGSDCVNEMIVDVGKSNFSGMVFRVSGMVRV